MDDDADFSRLDTRPRMGVSRNGVGSKKKKGWEGKMFYKIVEASREMNNTDQSFTTKEKGGQRDYCTKKLWKGGRKEKWKTGKNSKAHGKRSCKLTETGHPDRASSDRTCPW